MIGKNVPFSYASQQEVIKQHMKLLENAQDRYRKAVDRGDLAEDIEIRKNEVELWTRELERVVSEDQP